MWLWATEEPGCSPVSPISSLSSAFSVLTSMLVLGINSPVSGLDSGSNEKKMTAFLDYLRFSGSSSRTTRLHWLKQKRTEWLFELKRPHFQHEVPLEPGAQATTFEMSPPFLRTASACIGTALCRLVLGWGWPVGQSSPARKLGMTKCSSPYPSNWHSQEARHCARFLFASSQILNFSLETLGLEEMNSKGFPNFSDLHGSSSLRLNSLSSLTGIGGL